MRPSLWSLADHVQRLMDRAHQLVPQAGVPLIVPRSGIVELGFCFSEEYDFHAVLSAGR